MSAPTDTPTPMERVNRVQETVWARYKSAQVSDILPDANANVMLHEMADFSRQLAAELSAATQRAEAAEGLAEALKPLAGADSTIGDLPSEWLLMVPVKKKELDAARIALARYQATRNDNANP